MPSAPRVREFYNVSRRDFETEIAPSYQPAVLRALVRSWPAVQAAEQSRDALLQYLQRYACNNPVSLFVGAPDINRRYFYRDDMQGFNFEQLQGPFGAAMGKLISSIDQKNAPSMYMGATPIPSVLPGFERENSLDIVSPKVVPNIWIGSAATISTHFDTSENIACAVTGKRRFTLFPPEQVRNLYIGPLDSTPAGQPVSMVDLNHPDLERYPRFAEALKHALVVELEPGDAIYIPPLWWHNVDSFGDFNILVNYWWEELTPLTGSPFDSLVHSILSVSHLPSGQRQAWRAFFDHYVFGDGHPAEHLAPEHRGVLGELTPQMGKEIKTYLAHALQPGDGNKTR